MPSERNPKTVQVSVATVRGELESMRSRRKKINRFGGLGLVAEVELSSGYLFFHALPVRFYMIGCEDVSNRFNVNNTLIKYFKT